MSIPGKNLRRGEIWWVRLDPTVGSEIAKTRPCVVVSRDTVNRIRRTVVIVPISSSPRPQWPVSIEISCPGKVEGVVVFDQIRAAAKERFASYITMLSAEQTEAIGLGLRFILQL